MPDLGLPPGFPSGYSIGGATSLQFFVPGEPEPAHRPRSRVAYKAGKPYVQVYQDKRVTDYEDSVADWVRQQIRAAEIQGPSAQDVILPFEEHAIFLTLRFNMHRPVSYPKTIVQHTRRPDLDNLAKTVLDGLQKARVFKDDGLINELVLSKRYASAEHPLGVEIDLTAVRTPVP